MPTFVIGSGVGDNYAAFVLPIPDVTWFKSAVLGALYELTNPNNWIERGDVAVSFAVEEAAQMLNDFQLTNFNPFPIGMIMPFGGNTPPDGYKTCNGSTLSATDYPELFAVIGYIYGGSGDNFNVPNLVNNVPVGSGGDFLQGASGGEQSVTLTVADMPIHSHSDAGHSHTIPLNTSFVTQEGIGVGRLLNIPLVSDFTGVGFANITNTGLGGSHNNLQPYLAVPYIIYAGRI
jgi:microcystin-dependent protein